MDATLGRQTLATRWTLSVMRVDLIFGVETAKYTTYKQFKNIIMDFLFIVTQESGKNWKKMVTQACFN